MRIAVYAGTFDPVTRGHLSVIRTAAAVFDRLLVVVAENPKKRPLFTAAERTRFIGDAVAGLPNVECDHTDGYVVALARDRGARFLVRGVRGATDIEDEIALAQANAELAPEIRTFFVPASRELSQVSSSRLKELASSGLDVSSYCTPAVAAALAARLSKPDKAPESIP